MSELNPANRAFHYFEQNEGLPYKELSLIKKAIEEKKFQKVYAQAYFSPQNRHSVDIGGKFTSYDSPEVPLTIQKKMIRSLGMDKQINDALKQSDGFVKNIGYPKNLRLSSDVVKESVNSFRQAKRINQVQHQRYNPVLDTIGVKKLYEGIYNLNQKDTSAETIQPCTDRIVNNRTYLNNSVHLYELHEVQSYQQKRAKEMMRLSQIQPAKKFDSLMKQLMHQVVVIDGESLMSPKQIVAVKDYVQQKSKLRQPDPLKAFELFLARNVKGDDYISPNFKKEYEEEERNKERLRKAKKLEQTKTKLVSQLLGSAQKKIAESFQDKYLSNLRLLNNQTTNPNSDMPSFRTASNTPTMLPNLVNRSVEFKHQPINFIQALSTLRSTQVSGVNIQQETSRSYLPVDNETVITDLPINFDISLAPTDLRTNNPLAKQFMSHMNGRISHNLSISIMSDTAKDDQDQSHNQSRYEPPSVIHAQKPLSQLTSPHNPFIAKMAISNKESSKLESNSQTIQDNYSSPADFNSKKQNARYIMFQCQKDHFVKESTKLNTQMDRMQDQIDQHAQQEAELLERYLDLTTQTDQVNIVPFNELREQETVMKQNDYDTFLSPEAIKQAKSIDKKAIISINRNKKKTLWKPSRLRLSKDIKLVIDKMMSNSAE